MITIFSTPTCPRCRLLATALRRNGIDYNEQPLDAGPISSCLCDTGQWITEAPLVHVEKKWLVARELFDDAGSLVTGWREVLDDR